MAEDLRKFVGKWQVYKSENMEEFFKEVGVNYLVRKIISKISPEQTVTLERDTLKIISRSTFMTKEEIIKLNEEYEKNEEKMGVRFRCKARIEDGKLIVNQDVIYGGEHKPEEIIRERVGNETVVTMKVGDVISKRWLKMVE